MAVAPPNDLPVRWDFSVRPDGTARLAFTGELDTESTPASWTRLQAELTGTKLTSLDVDVSHLVSDSAGLALLYHLSTGGMTPGASVSLSGLNPELQHLLH